MGTKMYCQVAKECWDYPTMDEHPIQREAVMLLVASLISTGLAEPLPSQFIFSCFSSKHPKVFPIS